MKKYIKLWKITFVVIVFALVSCENFIDVPPKNAVTPANFFQTESDFEQAIIGAYAPLLGLNNSGVYSEWTMTEMRSDNSHFIYNPLIAGQLQAQHIADFLVEPDNPGIENMYRLNFLIISRANQVLVSIDDADLEQDVKDNYKGQACFLRALAYFNLVRFYGGVPLFTKPATSLEETMLLRSEADEVYEQIIEDAQIAANLLPDVGSQQTGKATSGAANTLLGNVFLTLQRWTDAETTLKKVTGYSLVDYASLFDPNNEGNAEMIFEIEYLEGTTLGLGSSFPYTFLPQLPDPSVITGVSPANQGGSGYNIPTPDLINAYEDKIKDKRFDVSIGFYSGASSLSGVIFDEQPYIKKYQHAHSLYNITGQNWPVYRYADVLLMLAEAVNEQGNNKSVAEGYLNEVRRRAGLDDIVAANQNELREIIMNERRIEFAFENKRWHDLVRTNKAVEVMNAYGLRIKANPGDYYYLTPNTGPIAASYNVTENKLIYPIPYREIKLNPKLDQNPR